MITLDLNQSQAIPRGIDFIGVYFLKSGPPKNYAIEEIIPEISGHDSVIPTENDNSFWASLNSNVDEEIRCDEDSSSDSSVPNSKLF